MARASAGASSAQPGLNNSRSVRANMTNFLLLSSCPLGPLCFSFGRRNEKGRRGGFPLLPFRVRFSGPDLGCPLWERPVSDRSLCFRRLRHNRLDVHIFAAELAVAETDATVDQCKKGMILAQADVVARVPLRAALAHDDVAGANHFAAELLHAKALGLRIAPVARGAACFFMCHL